MKELKMYRKISYAQCGEDLIIDFLLTDLMVSTGFYLDIGSHHPVMGNNTFLLESSGFSGICIEPNERFNKNYKRFRPKSNLVNSCFMEEAGIIDFYITNPDTLSTTNFKEVQELLVRDLIQGYKVKKLESITYKEIISKYEISKIEVLSIDNEENIDFLPQAFKDSGIYPLIICAETVTYDVSGNGTKKTKLINDICSSGYISFADTYINTIFVKEDIWKR